MEVDREKCQLLVEGPVQQDVGRGANAGGMESECISAIVQGEGRCAGLQ